MSEKGQGIQHISCSEGLLIRYQDQTGLHESRYSRDEVVFEVSAPDVWQVVGRARTVATLAWETPTHARMTVPGGSSSVDVAVQNYSGPRTPTAAATEDGLWKLDEQGMVRWSGIFMAGSWIVAASPEDEDAEFDVFEPFLATEPHLYDRPTEAGYSEAPRLKLLSDVAQLRRGDLGACAGERRTKYLCVGEHGASPQAVDPRRVEGNAALLELLTSKPPEPAHRP